MIGREQSVFVRPVPHDEVVEVVLLLLGENPRMLVVMIL
jgi:hypothetical protein